MRAFLKLKKSAGVPVTNSVHRMIRSANAARTLQDWHAAASSYRAALAADPTLQHIWVQLGHALKEGDLVEEARDAYEKAASLSDDAEPLIHIAYLYKAQERQHLAATYLVRAIRRGGLGETCLAELQAMVAMFKVLDVANLAKAVHALDTAAAPANTLLHDAKKALSEVLVAARNHEPDDDLRTLQSTTVALAEVCEPESVAQSTVGDGIVFDVTDLIGHFRHHRLPTGIQRVQIEVVTRALRGTAGTRVCCYLNERDCLVGIQPALFLDLARAAVSGSDSGADEWLVATARLFIELMTADPFVFKNSDILVNLGTSWWIYNYNLIIRNAKREYNISFVPFVHDLIPVMAVDHCVKGVVEDYISWLIGVFDHADRFLVNSESTGRDLKSAAARLGRSLDSAFIEVVKLDADFRRASAGGLGMSELGRWNLFPSTYCLIVSTIESRKNHVIALEAWAKLIDAYGLEYVPTLVCVGRNGWMNAPFFDRLKRDARLRSKVKLIERVSDEELELLYKGCRFTIYPSHYEGWGLPVTESLCYGRVPIVADNSSLPEACGRFGLFFESDVVSSLVATVEKALLDDGIIKGLEQEIAADFKPRSWTSIAAQIIRASVEAGAGKDTNDPPCVIAGRYYPVTHYKGTRIWTGLDSGEKFRSGAGWLWPEPNRCRTAAEGGVLRMQVGDLGGPLRLYLHLCGLDTVASTFVVVVHGRAIATGNLGSGERRWILGDISDINPDGIVSITVRGGSTEISEIMAGGKSKKVHASIGVAGFGLVRCDDEAGRLAFLESAAIGDLENVNAYVEHPASA